METRKQIKQENEAFTSLRTENNELIHTLPMAANVLFGSEHSRVLEAAMKSVLPSLPIHKTLDRKSWRNSSIHIHQKEECKQMYNGYLEGGARELMTFNERSRLLIKEMDRVNDYPDEIVPSNVLHTLPQLFPKHELITDIQREVRKNIMEDVRQEDSRNPYLQKIAAGEDDEKSCDTLDFQGVDTVLPPQSELNEITSIEIKDDESPSASNDTYSRTSTIDEHNFEERRRALTDQMIMMRKGTSVYSKDDMEDLMREAGIIDKTLKLARIDDELHDAYRLQTGFFVSRALHGYDTMMRTEEAIIALEKEHNRLVAFFVSQELIHDSLEW